MNNKNDDNIPGKQYLSEDIVDENFEGYDDFSSEEDYKYEGIPDEVKGYCPEVKGFWSQERINISCGAVCLVLFIVGALLIGNLLSRSNEKTTASTKEIVNPYSIDKQIERNKKARIHLVSLLAIKHDIYNEKFVNEIAEITFEEDQSYKEMLMFQDIKNFNPEELNKILDESPKTTPEEIKLISNKYGIATRQIAALLFDFYLMKEIKSIECNSSDDDFYYGDEYENDYGSRN